MSDTKNYFYIQADLVGNSVGTKSSDTENVLDDRGVIAQQFGRRGGQSLVNDLARAKHGTWSYGEIRFTDSYGLNTGGRSPKKIVHFCFPPVYEGDGTYLVCMKRWVACGKILVTLLDWQSKNPLEKISQVH